ncbi:MAG: FtsW/RodA/SpoVE family cell cycle protein, partial [Chloroflexi bacterium]|nr:FtsW/RodA/SpoVE family cell cycle protein [Chloroflexota bacterium]
MGQQSAMSSTSRRSPEKASSAPRSIRLNIDVPLLLVTITLVVLGILMLYSASWDISFLSTETHSPTYMLTRQLMWLGLGLVGMAALAWLNYHSWQHLATWSMLAAIAALIIVLLFGDETRSWRGGSYQPSEL